jgi:hypothetical protein
MVGHAVKPVADRLAIQQGVRFTDQNEKGSLKSVFRVVRVFQDALTDPKDHAAMAAHERGKGIFVTVAKETFEQLSIGQPRALVPEHGPAELLNDFACLADRHCICSVA